MKISDIFKNKTVFSFEVFPPNHTSDESVIYKTLDGLTGLEPDFISVTYSAGGKNNSSKTIQIASDIKNKYGIESVAHLTCISKTEEQVIDELEKLRENGIENILALRGDIFDDIVPGGRFNYASDLIEFIRDRYDFNIIAACYPEGHGESDSIVSDIHHLKHKVDSGTDHLISQLFLDNEHFYSFLERTQIAGINVPIEAGIMPITNKMQVERIVNEWGVHLPRKFEKLYERYEHNSEAFRDAGIAYAIDQIVDLVTQGVDGIHLYTMNNSYVARRIYEAVNSIINA